MDPGKRRFSSIILLSAAALLLLAIFIGTRMGERVISRATEQGETGVGTTIVPTAAPSDQPLPYGPNWKRTQILAAAPDPGFPDPRVPPVPPPTLPPSPKPTPTPMGGTPPPLGTPTPYARPTPTPNKNLPIWRRAKPLPVATATPSATPAGIPTRNLPTEEPSPILGPSTPP